MQGYKIEDCLVLWDVQSSVKGDFSKMMDILVKETGINIIKVIAIHNPFFFGLEGFEKINDSTAIGIWDL
jgi:hypothetical protein